MCTARVSLQSGDGGGNDLVGVGVGERGGDVVVVHPLDAVHREPREPVLVAERVALPIARP